MEEFGVGGCGAEFFDEEFEAFAGWAVAVAAVGIECCEHSAKFPDLLQLVTFEEELFLAGTRTFDVDRGVDTTVGESSVEA